MAIIWADNFNGIGSGTDIFGRTPSTSNGNTWNRKSGVLMEGDSGGNRIQANTTAFINATVDSATSEVDIQCEIEWPTTVDNSGIGSWFEDALNPVDSSGYVFWYHQSAGLLRISSYDSGGTRTDHASTSFSPSTATVYLFRLTIHTNGSTVELRGTVDGANSVSFDHSSGLTSRAHSGIISLAQSAANTGRWDNVQVSDYAVVGDKVPYSAMQLRMSIEDQWV